MDGAGKARRGSRHGKGVGRGGRAGGDLGGRRGGRGHFWGGPLSSVPAETAFCWTEVYLDGRLAPIVRPIDVLRTAVFVMVEAQAGEPIVEIRQDSHPCAIGAAHAPSLGPKAGDRARQVTRRYSGTGR